MKRILTTISLAALLAGTTMTAEAQFGGGKGPLAGSAELAKFFGNNKAFTTKIETSIKNSTQTQPMTMEMSMSMLDGKMRVDMDMTTMKGGQIPPNAVAQMKAMGMDKSITIIRPDQKLSYNIFPGMKAYAETTMTDKEVADAMNDSKVEKTSMGKETIDGHACEKSKVVVTDDKGAKHEVLVWNASDMKDFPIQMQMEENKGTIMMKYTDVKLEKPDAKLFEAPTGFTKYDNVQAMMQAEGMKRMSAGGFGPPTAK